jgi:hypothetical protein
MESGISTVMLRAGSVARVRGLAVADVTWWRFAAAGKAWSACVSWGWG